MFGTLLRQMHEGARIWMDNHVSFHAASCEWLSPASIVHITMTHLVWFGELLQLWNKTMRPTCQAAIFSCCESSLEFSKPYEKSVALMQELNNHLSVQVLCRVCPFPVSLINFHNRKLGLFLLLPKAGTCPQEM